MIYLFDVNVLLALMDSQHVAHQTVHGWFAGIGSARWATCPITENGFVRILSNPKYPNPVATPTDALSRLATACKLDGHEFWPDDLSMASDERFRRDRVLTSARVTDAYLLALAQHHDGKLATLDRRLAIDAVRDGAKSLHIIGTSLQ